MKEILSSLHFVATANKVSLSLKNCLNFNLTAWVVPAAIMFATAIVSAQSAEAVEAPITNDAYKHDLWKSVTEYKDVIVAEKTETIAKLADPNLNSADYALYTGYLRLLVYIKQDL